MVPLLTLSLAPRTVPVDAERGTVRGQLSLAIAATVQEGKDGGDQLSGGAVHLNELAEGHGNLTKVRPGS